MSDDSTFQSAVGRNAIVYRCLTPDPAQSLIFGGGATGGTLHTPDDSLYVLLSRCDIWNEKAAMGAIGAMRLRGTPGLFTHAPAVRQVCDLAAGEIRITLDTAQGQVRLCVRCLRDRDLVMLDVEDDRRQPGAWSVTIENWHEGDATRRVSDSLLESVHVNRTSCWARRNAMVGVDGESLGLRDPILGRAWGLWIAADTAAPGADDSTMALPPARHHRVRIATACQPPTDRSDALDLLQSRGRGLAQTPAHTLDDWTQGHRQWWRQFWQRSVVHLTSPSGDAEYEERLWHVNMYALACGMGGDYPMRFNGGPYLLDKDQRTWDYGYWGQNMRLVYLPMLAAGHHAFVRDYIDWYLGNRAFVRAQTKSLFGIDGLCWRETQSFWGADTASTPGEPDEVMHHHFTNNLEFCLLMELYHRATGDEAFLRDCLYPVLREVLKFFRQYATAGDDGRLHLQPAGAIEVWPQMIDPQSEICGLHHFLPRAIAWAEQFGESAEVIANWRDFLARLPDVPVGRWTVEAAYDQGIHDERYLLRSELTDDGIYLPAAGQTRQRTRRINMENAELYIIFPWDQVNLDSPAEPRRRVENTWSHRTWRHVNNGWAQDAVQLARLGWRDEAHAALREHARYSQRFPNGLFICAATPRFHGLITDTPYFDAAGAHLLSLHEMFVQNQDGVLKLAPAVPLTWSGKVRLHALDGLLVELRVRQGLPVHARITAQRSDVTLRVRNHRWEGMRVAAGADIDAVESGAVAQRTLAVGEFVVLSWQDVDGKTPIAFPEAPEVVWPDFRHRPPPAAYRGGHWHDERKNHGQVGLNEDGLFAATRRPPTISAR